jgi:uncharacterized membrane protein
LTKYQIVSCKLTEEDRKRKRQEKWKGKKIKAPPCQSKNSLKTILIKKATIIISYFRKIHVIPLLIKNDTIMIMAAGFFTIASYIQTLNT